MSYTLSLFRARPGVDPLEAARLDWHDEEADPDPIVEIPRAEQMAIAEELLRLDPRLQRDRDSDGIDLSAPHDAPGSLVPDYEVFSRGVLAYFGGDARRPDPTFSAARETLDHVAQIAQRFDLRVYDPQRDALVDPARDIEAVRAACLAGHVEAERRLEETRKSNAVPSQAVGVIVLLAIVMVAIQLGLPEGMRFYGMLAVPIVLFLVALMMLRAKATPRR